MATEREIRHHGPTTAPDSDRAERVHISVPPPLPRSIAWEPTDAAPESGPPQPLYDIFITQDALRQILAHAGGPDDGLQPFGLLAGDLCEDLDSGRKYVLVSGVCSSALPLLDDPHDLIPAEAWDTLRGSAEKLRGNLVGWYFRRGGPVALSETELNTHRKYFGEPWHSAILVTGEADDPRGGFFRQTADGMLAAPAMPFFEVVATRAIGSGERRTVLDWTNARTEAEVVRETVEPIDEEDADSTEATSTPFAARDGVSGPLAEEIARRSIVAVAARTAVELGEQRQKAEEAAREAEAEAARRAAELETARVAAEQAAQRTAELEREEAEEAEEAEADRRQAEAEAERLQAEDAAREAEEAAKQAEEEADRLVSDLEQLRTATAEAERRATELEEALRATEADAARRVAEQEAARQAAEAEAARQAAEAQSARKAADFEAELRRSEEAARIAAEEEAARRIEEAQQGRQQAEAEAERKAAQLESTLASAEIARQHAEKEAARRTAELEQARLAVEAEAERHSQELQ
ncbi:MAG: hypothetical protein WBP17_07150, partial [Gemmatimonadota bacterium]